MSMRRKAETLFELAEHPGGLFAMGDEYQLSGRVSARDGPLLTFLQDQASA